MSRIVGKIRAKKRGLGERLVSEFSDLRGTLRARAPLQKRYTIRTMELAYLRHRYRHMAGKVARNLDCMRLG